MNTIHTEATTDFMDNTYFTGVDYRAEFDMGFAYFMMDMDSEAIGVMSRLINSQDNLAEQYALQLMALYNN